MNELRQTLAKLPNKTHFGLLLLAWVMLFHFLGNSSFGYASTPSLFSWVGAVYDSNPDDSLGYLVSPLILALLYFRQDQWGPLEKQPWVPALGLLALAVALHAAGYLIQQARVSLVAFGLGVYALTGMLWGRRWMMAVAFPFSLMVFSVPLTAYTDPLTFPLRLVSTQMATGFCKWVLNLNLIREGTTVYHALPGGGRGFEFEVAAACSGIRSLTVVFLLTLVFGYLQFNTAWRRLVLVLAALPLALLGNIIRLTTVFTVGEAWGGEAGKRIETNLGFITFAVALAGVMILGRWLREPSVPAATVESTPATGTPKSHTL